MLVQVTSNYEETRAELDALLAIKDTSVAQVSELWVGLSAADCGHTCHQVRATTRANYSELKVVEAPTARVCTA